MSARDHAAMVRDSRVPAHLYPEDAARALGRVMHHVSLAERSPSEGARGPGFHDAPQEGEAAAVIAEALTGSRRRAGWR